MDKIRKFEDWEPEPVQIYLGKYPVEGGEKSQFDVILRSAGPYRLNEMIWGGVPTDITFVRESKLFQNAWKEYTENGKWKEYEKN